MTPRILCAAIWYKELPTQKFLAKNQDRGIIVCGHRHPHIIDQMLMLTGKRTVTNAVDGVGEYEQGFLTSDNRFVDRKEAITIAKNAGQITHNNYLTQLHSEDIY